MSKSIQGRVDAALWTAFIQPNETTTEALQRLQKEHAAQQKRVERLKQIDSNPDIALGELLHAHSALKQLLSQSAITAVEPPQATKSPLTDVSQW